MNSDLILILLTGFGAVLFIGIGASGLVRTRSRTDIILAKMRQADVTAHLKFGDARGEPRRWSFKTLHVLEAIKINRALSDLLNQSGLKVSKPKFYAITATIFILTSLLLNFFIKNIAIYISIAFILSIFTSIYFLAYMKNRRLEAFVRQFPAALDIIVRGVRAGLTLHEGLNLIAREIPGVVGVEFNRVVDSITLGLTASQSVLMLYKRVPAQEVNFLAIVLQIQEKTGGNAAEILENLSRIIRDRHRMREKIGALSMEAKSSATILAGLPVVVSALLFVSNRSYATLFIETETGRMALGGAILLMITGAIVMRFMIRIEI